MRKQGNIRALRLYKRSVRKEIPKLNDMKLENRNIANEDKTSTRRRDTVNLQNILKVPL